MQGKKKYFIVLVILIFITGTVGCKNREPVEELLDLEIIAAVDEISEEEITEPVITPVFVHVCGAVKDAGVYELPAGARVHEAIALAGGVTEEAATEYLNQARVLEDGERIYLPTQEEVATTEFQNTELFGEIANAIDREPGKVNINQASVEELKTLTGIGEAKARSIINYREQNGPFRKPEDLMQVEGIKEGTFRKIEHNITI